LRSPSGRIVGHTEGEIRGQLLEVDDEPGRGRGRGNGDDDDDDEEEEDDD